MIKVGEGIMMRKKIWMMFFSIMAVALMITTSVNAAITSSKNIGETKEQQLTTASNINVASGRIGLDKKAEIETKPDESADQKTDTSSDTAKPDEESDTKPNDQITSETGSDEIANNSDEIENNQDENEPSEPSGNLIWLAIQGDEVPDDGGSESPDPDPNGSSDSNLNIDNSDEIISAQPQIDIDEVLVASNSGIVDKDLTIDSSLSLNIMGYAQIDVISGSENLIDGPYFNGLDVSDKLSLAVISTSFMFLVRAIQILRVAFPLTASVFIATKICAKILGYVLYMIENGFDWITLDVTIGGYTLTNPIRKALEKIINPILEDVIRIFDSLADMSKTLIISYLQDLFNGTSFRELVSELYERSWLAVHAILLVLQNKDTTIIKNYFTQIGLSQNAAQILVNILDSYNSIFVNIRYNILGKFDAFMTYGRDSTSLRNIHAQINPDCQVEQGQYAAIIQIKAISAGQVFDTKTIGILYDGSGENTPSAGENLGIASGSTTMGSTTTQSTTNV